MGGLLNVAAKLRANEKYAKWVQYQAERLERLGVEVTFGKDATAADVMAAGADVVAIATGSTPRVPRIAGIDFGWDPQQAAEAPRWSSTQPGQEANYPHECPDALNLESRFAAEVRATAVPPAARAPKA